MMPAGTANTVCSPNVSSCSHPLSLPRHAMVQVPPAVQALARKTPRQVAEYVQQQADKIAALEAAAEEAKGAQGAVCSVGCTG